ALPTSFDLPTRTARVNAFIHPAEGLRPTARIESHLGQVEEAPRSIRGRPVVGLCHSRPLRTLELMFVSVSHDQFPLNVCLELDFVKQGVRMPVRHVRCPTVCFPRVAKPAGTLEMAPKRRMGVVVIQPEGNRSEQ